MPIVQWKERASENIFSISSGKNIPTAQCKVAKLVINTQRNIISMGVRCQFGEASECMVLNLQKRLGQKWLIYETK